MSFALTTEQYRNGTKTVTRRDGWAFLKVGEVFNGVEKCQGLKKGEKVVHLGPAVCTSNHREPLNAITPEDCILEGFPELTPAEFVEFYCKTHRGCTPDKVISRIEFKRL